MPVVLVLSMLLMLMIVLLFILALGILSSPVGSGGDSRRVLRYNSDYTEYFVHGGNEIVCNVDEFLREKNFKQSIPAVKVDDGLEINHQMATTALCRAVHLLSALQSSDGHWPAENAGSLFFLPPLAEGGDAEEEESEVKVRG